MSYLVPINIGIEPISKAAKSSLCLYNSVGGIVTFRTFPCPYCNQFRRIEALARQCIQCDSAALCSTDDHEYDCPFGLKESVVHHRLKNGMAHAILGKYRRKIDLSAEQKVFEIARKYSLDPESMLEKYKKVPILERDESEACRHDIQKVLEELDRENHLESFGNEAILQTIAAMCHEPKIISWKFKDYGPYVFWCRQQLERIVRKVCDERLSDFIRERTLIFAEDRLTNSDDSIQEIAKYLGRDHMYFQTLFRKYCLMTPKHFRDNGFGDRPHPPELPF